MSLSRLDVVSVDSENPTEDFAANLRAALLDAWTFHQDDKSGPNRVCGILRNLVLDAVTVDLSRRMKIIDWMLDAEESPRRIPNAKLPTIVVVLGLPFGGSSEFRKCMWWSPCKKSFDSVADCENMHGVFVPTTADIAKVTTATTQFPKYGVPKQETQLEILLRRFVGKKEREKFFNQDIFRFGAGLLLRSILEIKLSGLHSNPTHILLEGHEHAMHLAALKEVFSRESGWGGVRVVLVENSSEVTRTVVAPMLSEMTRHIRRLVLGPWRQDTVVQGMEATVVEWMTQTRADVAAVMGGPRDVLRLDGDAFVATDRRRDAAEAAVARAADWLVQ
ncbi:hypothetical protein HDU82_008235 [Entophlyctis luteolus]|nr:hypothetical protein HDU82_008235 [Entophlyctis luteolus]